MDHTYAARKQEKPAVSKTGPAPEQPSLDALRTGAAQPTQEQTGNRVDLPGAMRAKMENAFGADLPPCVSMRARPSRTRGRRPSPAAATSRSRRGDARYYQQRGQSRCSATRSATSTALRGEGAYRRAAAS